MFDSLLKAVVGTALLPVAVAVDVATLVVVPEGEVGQATGKTLGDIGKNLDKATDPDA